MRCPHCEPWRAGLLSPGHCVWSLEPLLSWVSCTLCLSKKLQMVQSQRLQPESPCTVASVVLRFSNKRHKKIRTGKVFCLSCAPLSPSSYYCLDPLEFLFLAHKIENAFTVAFPLPSAPSCTVNGDFPHSVLPGFPSCNSVSSGGFCVETEFFVPFSKLCCLYYQFSSDGALGPFSVLLPQNCCRLSSGHHSRAVTTGE